jgi:hypothetical protein
MRVLAEHNPDAAVSAFFRLPSSMLRATLLVLAALPCGARAPAALLSAMSPVQACRCVHACTPAAEWGACWRARTQRACMCRFVVDIYTETPQMLPEPLRQQVRAELSSAVRSGLDHVGACMSAAWRRRDKGVRATLAAVAAACTLRASHVRSILAALSYSRSNQACSSAGQAPRCLRVSVAPPPCIAYTLAADDRCRLALHARALAWAVDAHACAACRSMRW